MKSLINSLINYPFLKEQIKRFWTISALLLLFYVLAVIFPHYSSFSSDALLHADSMITILTMRHPVIIMLCVIVPFVTVVTLFSYLFQPKSTSAIHSLPLNKNQLLFTNILAGFVLFIIPLLILFLFLLRPIVWNDLDMVIRRIPNLPIELFPDGIASGTVINNLPTMFAFFFNTLLIFAFYFGLFLTAAMIAGSPVAYALLCAIFMVIPCGFLLLGHIVGTLYMFGYESYLFSQQLGQLFTFTNPAMLGTLYSFYTSSQNPSIIAQNKIPYYASYIIIGLALYSISYWCNHKRKQERAGDSIVFDPLKNVLIFLLSTLGMIIIAAFFLSLFSSVQAMYVGCVVGFAVAYYISQMIVEKAFNVLFKAKAIIKFGGAMLAIFAFVMAVIWFDIFGFQTYSPEPSEVEGIYLNSPHTMHGFDIEKQNHVFLDNMFIRNQEIIDQGLFYHREIVENRHSFGGVFLNNWIANQYDDFRSQSFAILLKNGKKVFRTYRLPDEFFQEIGFNKLLDSETVILSSFPSFGKPETITRITLELMLREVKEENIYTSEGISIEKPDEIISLLEEIKKDIIINQRDGGEMYGKNYDFNYISGFTIIDYKDRSNSLDHFSLERFENVENWLMQKGFISERISEMKTDTKKL